MPNKTKLAAFFLLLLALSLACSSETSNFVNPGVEGNQNARPEPSDSLPSPAGPPRNFHLGFTPFPYDFSPEAFDFTYRKIAGNADIIAHHFDSGVPWPEALSGQPYTQNLMGDWANRKANTPPDFKVYVAITPINLDRDALALYHGSETDMPLPPPWDGYAFNHPDVKTAFLNHAITIIEYFNPNYLAIGIEANSLLANSPEEWDAYLELHRHVYAQLKQAYPDLPIMVTVYGISFLPGYRDDVDHLAQLEALKDLLPYTDYYAISFYPFISNFKTGPLPDDLYDELFSLSDKPIAIAETAYPAQSFSIIDGDYTFDTDPGKQQEFFTTLLEEAQSRDFVFIITFFLRDYDQVADKIDFIDPDVIALWKDTGFFDENGEPRPVLDVWRTTLARPYED